MSKLTVLGMSIALASAVGFTANPALNEESAAGSNNESCRVESLYSEVFPGPDIHVQSYLGGTIERPMRFLTKVDPDRGSYELTIRETTSGVWEDQTSGLIIETGYCSVLGSGSSKTAILHWKGSYSSTLEFPSRY